MSLLIRQINTINSVIPDLIRNPAKTNIGASCAPLDTGLTANNHGEIASRRRHAGEGLGIMQTIADTKQNRSAGIEQQIPWRVIKVEALPSFRLHVEFVDGTEGMVDKSSFLKKRLWGVQSIAQRESVQYSARETRRSGMASGIRPGTGQDAQRAAKSKNLRDAVNAKIRSYLSVQQCEAAMLTPDPCTLSQRDNHRFVGEDRQASETQDSVVFN
ncbi:MAG: hypothetical protein NUV63_11635 [Gallionella sp.]|nr:hypothetical protein [Gallionella sp.]